MDVDPPSHNGAAPRTARPPAPAKTGPGALLRRVAGVALGIAGIALILHLDQRLQDNASLPELGQDMSFGLLFTVGLLTGFHCVAMCGPLVIGYTAKGASSGRHTYVSHLLYGAGKTLSYTVIGAAFGWLGSIIAFTPLVRGAVGIGAGVFLILFGLHMLHVFPALAHFHIKPPAALMHFVGTQYRKHSNPFLIGLLNGLMIVCGPLQALYVMAMGTGDPVEAGKLLFVFGLGTLPVMLSFGFLTSLISTRFTPKLLKASGVLVLVLGAIMLNRGLIMTGAGYDFASLTDRVQARLAPSDAQAGAATRDGVQVVRMVVTNEGFEPDRFTIRAGVPVRWVVDAGDSKLATCQSKLLVPQLGLSFDVHAGEQTFEFTPPEAGLLPYTCGMGMMTGRFEVVPAAP